MRNNNNINGSNLRVHGPTSVVVAEEDTVEENTQEEEDLSKGPAELQKLEVHRVHQRHNKAVQKKPHRGMCDAQQHVRSRLAIAKAHRPCVSKEPRQKTPMRLSHD